MRCGIGIAIVLVALALVTSAAPLPAAAAQPPLVFASETPAGPGTYVLAGISSVVGTAIYAPFKAVLLCPETAVGAAATLAVGAHAAAERLVRIGCTGSYLVTPEMVRGQREFYEGGGPIVEEPPLRLLPVAK